MNSSDTSFSSKHTVRNKSGLHMRPCSDFAILAKEQAPHVDIKIIKDGMEADARSIMSLLGLDAPEGSELGLRITSDNGPIPHEIVNNIRNKFDLLLSDKE